MSSWMSTLWPPSCCSIPLSALLGHSEPEAFPLMFPAAAACVCTCCQILLQQVVPSLVLQLGTSCRPCWRSLQPGQLSGRCSTPLAAVGWAGSFLPLFSLGTHGSSCTSIPGRAAGSALRSLIEGEASSSSSCFYEKCWLSGCGSIQGQGWGSCVLVEMVLTLFQATAAQEEVFQPQMEMEAVVPSCWVKIIYLSRSLFFPTAW